MHFAGVKNAATRAGVRFSYSNLSANVSSKTSIFLTFCWRTLLFTSYYSVSNEFNFGINS